MKEDKLEDIFKEIGAKFDIEEPGAGHRERFLEKLTASTSDKNLRKKSFSWWKPLSIAASVVVILGLFIGNRFLDINMDERVSKISPEVSNTEFYFANLIEQQVKELESQSSPETQNIIDDTLFQLEKLDSDYKKLKEDLLLGGNSKFILSAMIQNFQTRIDLMEDVLNQIETIKTLKEQDNENLTI